MEQNILLWLDPIRMWKRLSRELRLAFTTACVAGGITHLYVFSNLLLSNDAVGYAFTRNEHLTSGRWALGFFSSLSSYVQMPVVIGLIAVLALAATAGLTVRILALHSTVGILLTSVLLVTFPTVACTFAYMFTADAYFIALFFNVTAVYLTKRYRFGWAAAIILIATGCGIYQAYICYAATLFLMDCIIMLMEEETLKKTMWTGLRYVGCLLAALVLYYGIEMLLLHYHQATLTTYMGMDTIASFNIVERLRAIPLAYKTYASYFFRWSFAVPVCKYFHYLAVVMLFVSVCYLIFRKTLWKQPARCILIFVGGGLLPLTMNLSAVLAYKGSVHRLMIYAFILLFAAVVKCAELVAENSVLIGDCRRMGLVLPAVSLFCCAAVAWNNFCLCNVGYHALQLNYENTYAIANRIVDRVESLDGYTTDTSVALIGSVNQELYGTRKYYAKDFEVSLSSETLFPPLIYQVFLWHYIGSDMPYPTAEQYDFLNNSKEVADMPVYPANGSVAMINGIAVVKLGEGSIQ